MQPTALVHEAYERLIHYDMGYENREHFLNVAAAAMRRLRIDDAEEEIIEARGRLGEDLIERGPNGYRQSAESWRN